MQQVLRTHRACSPPRSKIYGGFDWKLSRFLHADSTVEGLPPGPYAAGGTPARAIAFAPDLDLSRTRSLVEHKRITAGLLQVGGCGADKARVHPCLDTSTVWLNHTKRLALFALVFGRARSTY